MRNLKRQGASRTTSSTKLALAVAAGIAVLTAATEGAAQAIAPTQPVQPAVPAVTNSPTPDESTMDWKFAGRLSAQVSYDDNIFIQPTDKKKDYIWRVAPSLALGLGDFRTEFAPYAPIPHLLAFTGEEDLPRKDFAYASYTPEGVFFSKYTGENDFNHDVRLAARRETELWNLQAIVHYQNISDTNIDLGQRLRQSYYTASLGGEYAFTGKVTGGARLEGNRDEYAGGYTSTDARATAYVDYQLAPKTNVGLGATAGSLAVASGADQTYMEPFLQLRYEPTAKLSFSGQAGEEFRHFDSTVGDRSQFVFALEGDLEPSDGTKLFLSSKRQTDSSARYSGENIVGTVYQGGIRQRFLQRLYLALSGGFVRNDYENNQLQAAPIDRRDNYYFSKVSASCDVTRHGTIELSYEYRKNDSSIPTFGFTENVISLGASILF